MDGTRSFLIGEKRAVVIDPGPDVEEHVRALVSALEGASQVSILLTHHHGDHCGGAWGLSEALGATVYGPPSTGFRPLPEGEPIPTDVGDLIPLATPGHTRDHLAFFWPRAGALFVGDLLLGRGATTWLGEYPGCVADYLDSLKAIADLAPQALFPAHGPAIGDPPKAIQRFRQHRLDRLEELRVARASDPGASPEELARTVYGKELPSGVVKAAVSSIEVMLHHLDWMDGG